MATPYSQDLRDRVLAAYDRGMPTKKIAEVFAVSPAWARGIKQRRRETGETSARPMGGATVSKIDRVRLADLVKERPDATLRELRERLKGVRCATTVDGAINRDVFDAFVDQVLAPELRPGDAESGRGGDAGEGDVAELPLSGRRSEEPA